MYKRIDEDVEEITGFSYMSKSNFEEAVILRGNWVDISVSGGDTSVGIYYEDIPKLIKALEAAKAHKERHEQHN